MDNEPKAGGAGKGKSIAIGAGLGMIIGWLIGNAAYGLVLGAGAGLVWRMMNKK